MPFSISLTIPIACSPRLKIIHISFFVKGNDLYRQIDGTGNLLGVGMYLYTTQSTDFSFGDILLLYSDALTETPNEKGEFISEAQLISFMEEHRGLAPEEIKNNIVHLFKSYAGDRMHDDLTIIVCARTIQ